MPDVCVIRREHSAAARFWQAHWATTSSIGHCIGVGAGLSMSGVNTYKTPGNRFCITGKVLCLCSCHVIIPS